MPRLQNLEYARDLLLGNPDWQKLLHMPANGLFSERRVNNFFNVSTVVNREVSKVTVNWKQLNFVLRVSSFKESLHNGFEQMTSCVSFVVASKS